MFSYYGSKKSTIHLYPPPKHDLIIEAFAGAGTYAMKYFYKDVILVEKYDVIANIWKWLQKCSKSDINKLPHKLTRKENLNNIDFDCIEAKHLMGYLIGEASQSPRNIQSKRNEVRPNKINFRLNYIKEHLENIKHWKIIHGSYREIENKKATWFIDPPYQHGGYVYKENKIDYNYLRIWIKSRNGQIIACENTKADWMEFKPMKTIKGSVRKTAEAIWSNYKTNYEYQPGRLF